LENREGLVENAMKYKGREQYHQSEARKDKRPAADRKPHTGIAIKKENEPHVFGVSIGHTKNLPGNRDGHGHGSSHFSTGPYLGSNSTSPLAGTHLSQQF
jgi:hypothetical protein